MALTLDPATEAHIQQALAARRAEIIAELEESVARARRGEGVTGEELRARYEARKAVFEYPAS
jgi:predicted transcriptional regulator